MARDTVGDVTLPRILLVAAACLMAARAAPAQTQAQPATWPADGVVRLVAAAVAQTAHAVRYDGAYRRIPYPMGDVQTFFRRRGTARPRSSNASDYTAGDVVTWMLPGNLPHVGLVIDRRSADGVRPLVVHNIGRGPEIEDTLFAFPITGHYRYRGD